MKKNLIISLIVLPTIVLSQKAPIKYGKVDKEDLAMTVYELDTSAPAVILCDYGHFNTTSLDFTRTLRIKILKKEGYEWADQVFRTSSKTSIQGKTFNLENGNVTVDKLKANQIFREQVTEDIYNMRFAMPNVKIGSVIDIRYIFPLIPDEWSFQEEIPVRHSELYLPDHPNLRFRKNFIGYEALTSSAKSRWIAKNMPAFKREPYISSPENYMAKFEFDLLDINVPGFYHTWTTSWEAVNEHLLKHKYFGEAFHSRAAIYLNDIAKEIKENYTSPEDKLKAAFDAMKQIKWNEKKRLYTSTTTLATVFKDQTGNSTDINLILLQLLKKLDFDAYPLAMSSRDNGMLNPVFPSLNKLNYVVVYTNIDDKEYILDATEEYLPYDVLPVRCLNGQGRIIDYDRTGWVGIKTNKKDKEVSINTLELSPDHTISGTIQYAAYEYAAYNFRLDYKEYNSESEYLDDFIRDKPGLSIEEMTIKNIDSIYNPIKTESKVKISNQVTVLDDLLYINLLLYDQMKNNPFRLEQRNYPVDYAYPIDKKYIIKLTIPENYSVEKVPKMMNLKLPGNAASFVYRINYKDNVIQLTYKFNVNETLFLMNDYGVLKEFYHKMIERQAEPLILKMN